MQRCICGAQLVWDPGYGFLCVRCGAKPWRCYCVPGDGMRETGTDGKDPRRTGHDPDEGSVEGS
jgi:hypothetical protein